MPITPISTAVGHGGWMALVAFVVGLVVRIVKSDKVDEALAFMGLPSIPKRALPWISLALGLLAGVIEAKVAGASWDAAALAGAWGLVSGGVAVAGNETVPTIARALMPGVANTVFGPKAGPR
jgi:hypothetical protein